MRIRNTYQLLLCLVLVLASCEEQYPWELQQADGRAIVIDALLTNEATAQEILISLTNLQINQEQEFISGAEVYVEVGNRRWDFTESADKPGHYYSGEFRAVIRRNYMLTVEVEDEVFQARAEGIAVGSLKPLQVQWVPELEMYRYVPQEYANPSMIKVYYNWSENLRYCEQYGSCTAQEAVYSLYNIDVNQQFGPEKEVIYFPAGTTITRKKYSLTEAHQQFIRGLLMETEWRGGLFDVQQGNVPSNFSNGALGFFGICMVDVDSTVVE